MPELLFVLVLTFLKPGVGPVTTTSAPMTLAACHSALAANSALLGDHMISAKCDTAPGGQ
jgi:hypothetical protein